MKKLTCMLLAAVLLLTLTACGGAAPAQTTEAAPVDLQELFNSMADKLPGMVAMDDAMMMNFCGIDPEKCTQAVTAIAGAGMLTDEIWLIEAVDESAVDEIEELASTRLRMKAEETESYAPDQYEVVKEAKTIRSGKFFALIVTPEVEAVAKLVTDAIGQ